MNPPSKNPSVATMIPAGSRPAARATQTSPARASPREVPPERRGPVAEPSPRLDAGDPGGLLRGRPPATRGRSSASSPRRRSLRPRRGRRLLRDAHRAESAPPGRPPRASARPRPAPPRPAPAGSARPERAARPDAAEQLRNLHEVKAALAELAHDHGQRLRRLVPAAVDVKHDDRAGARLVDDVRIIRVLRRSRARIARNDVPGHRRKVQVLKHVDQTASSTRRTADETPRCACRISPAPPRSDLSPRRCARPAGAPCAGVRTSDRRIRPADRPPAPPSPRDGFRPSVPETKIVTGIRSRLSMSNTLRSNLSGGCASRRRRT